MKIRHGPVTSFTSVLYSFEAIEAALRALSFTPVLMWTVLLKERTSMLSLATGPGSTSKMEFAIVYFGSVTFSSIS